MKPTLARGASSKRKVPPIMTKDDGIRDDDILDSARDSVLDGTLDDDEEDCEVRL